jgi:hypothetical protein
VTVEFPCEFEKLEIFLELRKEKMRLGVDWLVGERAQNLVVVELREK